jgi:hypothetical protein
MYLGIDQSKRSTGMVMLDNNGNLKDFRLICPSMTLDGVELGDYQIDQYDDFLYKNNININKPKVALIEGLSFGAVGSAKDILAGLNWGFRLHSLRYFKFYLGIVPVSQWRSKVLSKEEQREAKAIGKDGQKKAVVAKLPDDIRVAFTEYVKSKGFKKESLYDLADAYWISRYAFGIDSAKKSIDK